MSKLSRDTVFSLMAYMLSVRASCNRMFVGCLIVKDKKHIVSSGVNGPMTWDCDDRKCDLTKPCQHAIHAEANAIQYAYDNGVDLEGTTLYCTHAPCLSCARLIVLHGIKRICYVIPYRITDGIDFLKDAKLEVININLPKQNEPT